MEQPAYSWMWKLRDFSTEVGRHVNDSVVTLDYFRYGAPWKKATKIWGVNCDLDPIRQRCAGGRLHPRLLRGRLSGETATHLAQAYPKKLADQWAACLLRGCRRAVDLDATLGYPCEGPAGRPQRPLFAEAFVPLGSVAPLVAVGEGAPAAESRRFGAARQGPRDLRRTRVGPSAQ